jgi:hypothetical protein
MKRTIVHGYCRSDGTPVRTHKREIDSSKSSTMSTEHKNQVAGLRTLNKDEVDQIQSKELQLQIENDGVAYRQRLEPAYKNLINKRASGSYDKSRANKMFYNILTDYSRQHRDDLGPVNMDTRMDAAIEMRKDFDDEASVGGYDHLLYKKYK